MARRAGCRTAPQKVRGSRSAVSQRRGDLQRLRRRRCRRTADPVRCRSANPVVIRVVAPDARHRAADQVDQRLSLRSLPPAGNHPGGPNPHSPDFRQRSVPAADDRAVAARQRLHPHRRDRHHSHGRGRVHGPRGQRADTVRGFLHAAEQGNHAADVPGSVFAGPRPAGQRLSDPVAAFALGLPAPRTARADR